jgi:DNA-binding NtrC family response regulator
LIGGARLRTRCPFPDSDSGVSSDNPSVLFIDDDADVLATAETLLRRNGWRMVRAQSPAEAWSLLAGEPVDLVLLDLNFSRQATSGEEGLRFLSELKAHDPEAVVVVVTGHSGVNVAVTAMKSGASDFVMKPWSNSRLMDTLRDAMALRRRADAGAVTAAEDPAVLIGESPAIQKARQLIERVAPTQAAVLFHGDAGVGKSLAAQALHARSTRSMRLLVRLDLRSGTGAGPAVARAEGGTLLLEELAAMSPSTQAELLTALEKGADVRLVSTTRDLAAARSMVRDDLMARLAVIEISMPSLWARGADVILLAEHFVRLFSRRHGRAPKPLDEGAVEQLMGDPPAGEVRGLRQAAERAVVLGDTDILTASDFAPSAMAGQPGGSKPDLNLARSERSAVEAALKRHGHNVSKAARDLGLTRAALYRRMLKHGL